MSDLNPDHLTDLATRIRADVMRLFAGLLPRVDAATPTTEPCPTCSGPTRRTTGMVCQTCGTDYGPPTTPAEPLDLEAIEARVPHGYDAPWRVTSDPDTGDWYVAYDTDNPLAGLVATVPDYGYHLAEFIAHARTDVPALLARVRELETALADAHAETMQIAGELADERTLHQETIAERNRFRGHSEMLNSALWTAAVALGEVPEGAETVPHDPTRVERLAAEVARLRGELEVPGE